MSIKRYEVNGSSSVFEDESGSLVDYQDDAALEAKCAALAAELSAVETIHNDAVFITDEHYEQCPPEVQKMIRSLAVLQIPAYQAFLAEVRAQAKADGVQEYADSFRHSASKIRECNGDTIHVRALLHHAKNADEFAAQIRKGVQS